jgi:hypothetical protein
MDATELLRWGELEEERRRAARRGPLAAPPLLWAVLGGALLFAELARRLGAFGDVAAGGATWIGASELWVTALAVSHLVVFFGAPFRTYWRRDSALLARLPLTGGALHRLAALRAIRATNRVSAACAIGGLALGCFHSWELAARHLVLLLLAWLGAGLFAPAVVLSAGATVASDKAEAMLKSFGGEFSAPRTTWLGALPGMAAAALALELIAGASWAAGGIPPGASPLWFLLPGLLVPLGAAVWARARADALMPAALREVAALDQERLAHVDLSQPSPLERAWFKLVMSLEARLVANKDARLLRRRYPSPYFTIPLGVVALAVASFTAREGLLAWAGVLLAAMAAYCVLMAARMIALPTEHARLMSTLPLSERDVLRSKRLHAALRLLLFCGGGGALVVWRAHEQVGAAVLVVSVLFGALVASWVAVR